MRYSMRLPSRQGGRRRAVDPEGEPGRRDPGEVAGVREEGEDLLEGRRDLLRLVERVHRPASLAESVREAARLSRNGRSRAGAGGRRGAASRRCAGPGVARDDEGDGVDDGADRRRGRRESRPRPSTCRGGSPSMSIRSAGFGAPTAIVRSSDDLDFVARLHERDLVEPEDACRAATPSVSFCGDDGLDRLGDLVDRQAEAERDDRGGLREADVAELLRGDAGA